MYPVEKEIGQALWNLGDDRPYVVTDENSLVFNVDHNLFIKQLLNGGEGSIESDGFTVFSHLSYANGKVAFLAAGPARSKSVVELDVRTNKASLFNFYNTYILMFCRDSEVIIIKLKIEIVRESRSSAEINQLPISAPSLKTFISDGVQVQGYFYPPTVYLYSTLLINI